jgi:hypothetical protein
VAGLLLACSLGGMITTNATLQQNCTAVGHALAAEGDPASLASAAAAVWLIYRHGAHRQRCIGSVAACWWSGSL